MIVVINQQSKAENNSLYISKEIKKYESKNLAHLLKINGHLIPKY
jgi:hypothetical protein